MPFFICEISRSRFQGSAISFPSLDFMWLFFPIFLSVSLEIFLVFSLPFETVFCALFLSFWLFVSFPFSLSIYFAKAFAISTIAIAMFFASGRIILSSHRTIARFTKPLGLVSAVFTTAFTNNSIDHDYGIITQGLLC